MDGCCDIFFVCLHACVCVDSREVGNRFLKGHTVSSVTGCGLVCTGLRGTETTTEMILITEIVGCLNLISLSVPLTDVIVLTGSFVSFTHSIDVTMEIFSAGLIICDPPSLSVGTSVSLSAFITLWLFVGVCLSLSLLDRLNKNQTSK